MKEESLLSSLSNVSSSHPHNNNNDFFNDSSFAGVQLQAKPHQIKDEEQVNLNQLAIFPNRVALSPKNNVLLLSCWPQDNNILQSSQNVSQFRNLQSQDLQHQPIIDTNQTIKIQKNQFLIDKIEDSSSSDHIGTIIKNQTKNIPKNYGKAIITYIQKERTNFEIVLKQQGIEYQQLFNQLTRKKKYINTIANLRDLWLDFKHAKCMRILSNQFLRKYALQYIFNSRICNYTSHVKYRKRLQQAIKTPGSFRHIKQY